VLEFAVVLFFLQNSTQIPSLVAFILLYSLDSLFMKLINWERKGKFKQMEIKHLHCH